MRHNVWKGFEESLRHQVMARSGPGKSRLTRPCSGPMPGNPDPAKSNGQILNLDTVRRMPAEVRLPVQYARGAAFQAGGRGACPKLHPRGFKQPTMMRRSYHPKRWNMAQGF